MNDERDAMHKRSWRDSFLAAAVQAIFGTLLTCLLSLVSCPMLWAQEMKVGYVNLAKVFEGYQRTKASDAALENEGKQKEAELEGRTNELDKLRQNLELLNDEARETKSREVAEKAEELQWLRSNTARDLDRKRDKIAKGILQEIQRGLEEYAKANGFSLIFDSRSLVYAQSAYDVTDDVLKLLNSRVSASR